MRNHSEEIYDKIGNKSDYLRIMKLTGRTMSEVRAMNCVDVIEILAIDNIMNV